MCLSTSELADSALCRLIASVLLLLVFHFTMHQKSVIRLTYLPNCTAASLIWRPSFHLYFLLLWRCSGLNTWLLNERERQCTVVVDAFCHYYVLVVARVHSPLRTVIFSVFLFLQLLNGKFKWAECVKRWYELAGAIDTCTLNDAYMTWVHSWKCIHGLLSLYRLLQEEGETRAIPDRDHSVRRN